MSDFRAVPAVQKLASTGGDVSEFLACEYPQRGLRVQHFTFLEFQRPSRKYPAPEVAGNVAGLFVPLGALVHVGKLSVGLNWRTSPGAVGDHEIVTNPGAAFPIVSNGGAGVKLSTTGSLSA